MSTLWHRHQGHDTVLRIRNFSLCCSDVYLCRTVEKISTSNCGFIAIQTREPVEGWKDFSSSVEKVVAARTDKVVDIYACVLRRSEPSPNHLSCQLFLLVDYSWGLLLTTRMINDVRREAHVYMCNLFSFALACKYMKAIACWVEIGSTDAIWSCLFERREIFHFKARWLKNDDESGREAAQWRLKNPTKGR